MPGLLVPAAVMRDPTTPSLRRTGCVNPW